jgi:hypothetical protein
MDFFLIIIVGLFILGILVEAILGLCAFFIPKDVRDNIAKWFGYLMIANGIFVGSIVGGWIGNGHLAKVIGAVVGGLIILGLIKRKDEEQGKF